jgi:hypothetical protein
MRPKTHKVDDIETSNRGRTPRPERQPGLQFKSSLLKKSLVDMHETPTMLPPRNDLRRHLDTEVQDEVMDGVMDGVTEPVPAQNKPSRPKQIDPRINPDGVSNYDPVLMMTPGSTIPVSAAGEVGKILPKRTRQLKAVCIPTEHTHGAIRRDRALDSEASDSVRGGQNESTPDCE